MDFNNSYSASIFAKIEKSFFYDTSRTIIERWSNVFLSTYKHTYMYVCMQMTLKLAQKCVGQIYILSQ